MLVVAATVASFAVSVVAPGVASAYPSPTVPLRGHGWGPGVGMGQWGALGYALAGTGYEAILDHYYGGTQLAPLTSAQDATNISVAITENAGSSVIVTSSSPFTVAGTAVPAGGAAMMSLVNGSWEVSVSSSCAGPWGNPVSTGLTNPTAVPSVTPALGSPSTASEVLQLCQAGGNLFLRGTIEGTTNSAGAPRTVNTLPLEDYVADVVPSESPAYWGRLGGAGPQGEAWGFQELEAQAVAARSYVMAELVADGGPGYFGYADICDLACQTYRGVANENALTTLATTDTAGQVMELSSGSSRGAIASTQYSASTGGYTAGGAFPAVVDAGDSVCVPTACNPDHDWTASVPVSTIESTWPQLGTLQSISVTGRNGLGAYGGRVTSMVLLGSDGDVSLTGAAFAGALGLRSDWFTAASSLTAPVVGMVAAGDGRGYNEVGVDGNVYSFGDAPAAGSMVGIHLNQPIVGMAAVPGGGGYWEVAADGGIFSFGDAHFYGSMGGHPLNQPIVGMAAVPGGGGYWEVAADGGIFSFGTARFYGAASG